MKHHLKQTKVIGKVVETWGKVLNLPIVIVGFSEKK